MATNERFDEAVSKWLEESAPAGLSERVLNTTFERTRRSRQHAGWRALLGRPEMLRFATALGSAAVLVVVAVVAVDFFANQSGIGGPPTPSPSPGSVLLARGNFVTGDATIELEANAQGSAVTGTMTVSHTAPDGVYSYAVDLQCARTTEDGLIIIGGYATQANDLGSVLAPVGSHAAIVLKRGSPAESRIWTQKGGPSYGAADCLTYLHEKLFWERTAHPDGVLVEAVDGTVEFGPPGAAATPSPLLALGAFESVRGMVELGAFGEGTSVMGYMTVWAQERSGGSFTVDLQCARTTSDGLIMIGGRVTESTTALAPVDTWAAIGLKRGSPVQAEVWYLRGGQPIAGANSCLEGLDAQIEFELSVSEADPPDYNLQPIDGSVEFGPQ